MHLVDRREYPTIGSGMWWAAQTVTTVGYGDSVPSQTAGRIVAVYVMLAGIACVTVVTAAVSAVLIEGVRASKNESTDVAALLAGLDERLARIERLASRSADPERAGVPVARPEYTGSQNREHGRPRCPNSLKLTERASDESVSKPDFAP